MGQLPFSPPAKINYRYGLIYSISGFNTIVIGEDEGTKKRREGGKDGN
jgi:hypothetical protein